MPAKWSSLRDKHTAATRELIVDAVVDVLATSGAFDLTYVEIARRAGISVRTVYRHFPTRAALLEALSRRVNGAVGIREYPRTRDGVATIVRNLFPRFDRNAALIIAQINAGFGGLRAKARHKRVSVVHDVFTTAMPNLDPERRKAAAGVVSCLISANTWYRLRDEVGLDGERAGEVTAWALDTLWRALEAEDRRRS